VILNSRFNLGSGIVGAAPQLPFQSKSLATQEVFMPAVIARSNRFGPHVACSMIDFPIWKWQEIFMDPEIHYRTFSLRLHPKNARWKVGIIGFG